ncbi:TetR family transcriptional regulator [Schaalia sp. HMT-877]|nr:transcriptional regulator, TetR family [Actinomyces sp. oral taxon 877 str. F0543]WLD80602.1 TetR family transcriptional regulator [Schaalia sp. HMT-877]
MSTGSAPDRGRITREQILAAAMALLDQRGLPDLTMRKLAAELGIRPSALYWHFPDKQTLLARLADQIVGSAPQPPVSGPGADDGSGRGSSAARYGTPNGHRGAACSGAAAHPDGPGEDRSPASSEAAAHPGGSTEHQGTARPRTAHAVPWERAMRASADTMRSRLLAHRDGAEIVSSSIALGLTRLPLTAMIHEPLHRAGASAETIDIAARTLGHFLLGHAFDEQQAEAARALGVEPALPRLRLDPASAEAAFRAGVDLIVAGTAVRIAADGA